jgi:hypothetical protein
MRVLFAFKIDLHQMLRETLPCALNRRAIGKGFANAQRPVNGEGVHGRISSVDSGGTSFGTAATLTSAGHYQAYPTLATGAGVANTPPVGEVFTPCIQASAINTPIVVNGPALGAGATLVTVRAWGFQL